MIFILCAFYFLRFWGNVLSSYAFGNSSRKKLVHQMPLKDLALWRQITHWELSCIDLYENWCWAGYGQGWSSNLRTGWWKFSFIIGVCLIFKIHLDTFLLVFSLPHTSFHLIKFFLQFPEPYVLFAVFSDSPSSSTPCLHCLTAFLYSHYFICEQFISLLCQKMLHYCNDSF